MAANAEKASAWRQLSDIAGNINMSGVKAK